MASTYTWANPEQTCLILDDGAGNSKGVPVATDNRDYAAYLASAITADAYVAPAAAPEPTAAEKLAAAGLTVEELTALLGL